MVAERRGMLMPACFLAAAQTPFVHRAVSLAYLPPTLPPQKTGSEFKTFCENKSELDKEKLHAKLRALLLPHAKGGGAPDALCNEE